MLHHIQNVLPFHEGCTLYRLSDSLTTSHVVAVGTASGIVTASMAVADPNTFLPWMQLIGLGLGSVASAVSILLAVVKWYRGDKENGHD